MNSIFLKELQDYSQAELMEIFDLLPEQFTEIMDNLLEKKVFIKHNYLYNLRYVGFISLGEKVAFSFPKYCFRMDKNTIMQIICLFQEYSKREKLDKEEIETLGNIQSDNNKNLISTVLFLLEDYLEQGIYSEEIQYDELNGSGDIDWEKTINNVYPIHYKQQSIYLDFYTKSTVVDSEHIVTKIHKYVLNQSQAFLKNSGFDYFFNYEQEPFEILDNDIINAEYLLSTLESEISVQFNDRKILLLKMMYSFLSNESSIDSEETLNLYGTRNFNLVWEKVCGFIFNNIYNELSKKKVIDRPIWKNSLSGKKFESNRTLTPDIISKYQRNNHNSLFILDAKYYNIKFLENKVASAPDLEDITKQYLYELSLNKYLSENKLDIALNAFLFPTEEKHFAKIGKVSIEFLKDMGLKDIQLYKLPAEKVYDYYVKRKKLSGEELDFFGSGAKIK